MASPPKSCLFMCAPKKDGIAWTALKEKTVDGSITSSDEGSFEELSFDSLYSGENDNSRYKTELCRSFDETGQCKYGHKCQFAHGPEELRSLNRHPRYKTELCRRFHKTGFCSYGTRCHFLHDSNEQHIIYRKEKKKEESGGSLQKLSAKSISGVFDGNKVDPLLQMQVDLFPLQPSFPSCQTELLRALLSLQEIPDKDQVTMALLYQQLLKKNYSGIQKFSQQLSLPINASGEF